MLLDEYKDVPYKVINFLGAEINYGGRVTDDKDVRLIKTILQGFINREVRDKQCSADRWWVSYLSLRVCSHCVMVTSTLNLVCTTRRLHVR